MTASFTIIKISYSISADLYFRNFKISEYFGCSFSVCLRWSQSINLRENGHSNSMTFALLEKPHTLLTPVWITQNDGAVCSRLINVHSLFSCKVCLIFSNCRSFYFYFLYAVFRSQQKKILFISNFSGLTRIILDTEFIWWNKHWYKSEQALVPTWSDYC